MDAIFPVPNAWYPILREPVERVRGSLVAEKWSSTNRIRSQFARIKAAGRRCYQLWLLRKTGLFGFKARHFAAENERQKRFESKNQDISQSGNQETSGP
jgi:hypothetical protein